MTDIQRLALQKGGYPPVPTTMEQKNPRYDKLRDQKEETRLRGFSAAIHGNCEAAAHAKRGSKEDTGGVHPRASIALKHDE
jgi:hypothetical protein